MLVLWQLYSSKQLDSWLLAHLAHLLEVLLTTQTFSSHAHGCFRPVVHFDFILLLAAFLVTVQVFHSPGSFENVEGFRWLWYSQGGHFVTEA